MLRVKNVVPKQRLIVFTWIVALLMLILTSRFFQLQIYQASEYRSKAESNRIKALKINAPRGLILDRNNTILVDNKPTYVLSAIPNEIQDKNKVFHTISNLTGIDSLLLKENFKKYYRNRFAPTRLIKDLTFEQISIIEEHKLDLQGLQITQFPERFYPTTISGTHFLGYVNEVNLNIYNSLEQKELYELGDLIGWHGIEKQNENNLRGDKGIRFIEVDAFGREVGLVEDYSTVFPIPGNDIQLTIDLGLQELLETLMQDYRGVAVVSNPKNGDILAYVSSPSHAPDLFTGAVTSAEWNEILGDPGRPLVDRVSTGQYPPGSTLKMITAMKLIEERLIDPFWTANCTGKYFFGDREFGCWNEEGHGDVNLQEAIAQSCNVYFYKVIQKLSITEWSETCRQFGFGEKTHIDLPTEKRGVIPTKDYMNRRYGRWGWSKGSMLNMVIGQGEVLVTPLQILNYINLIATRGSASRIHLVKDNINPASVSPTYSRQTWSKLETYLHAVITDKKGTGKAANPKINGLKIYGKTGTAENPHGEPHAWFIGYGKKAKDIISLAILVENGGHGGETSAPIARHIFKYSFGVNGKQE